MNEDGQLIVRDMPRYSLPVNLASGDQIEFDIAYDGAHGLLGFAEFDFIKKGEF